MKGRSSQKQQIGFTIIELLVATVVFSVILIIITTGILHITRTYYKGIVLTNTQNTARSIMDSIGQSIQFSGGTISWPQPAQNGGNRVLSGRGCIGDQQYDYQLGYQVMGSPNPTLKQSADALTLTTGVAACASRVGSFTPGTTELLGTHMRLTNFSVTPLAGNNNLYEISVTVVYGDYDLLCDRSLSPNTQPGGCAPSAPAVSSPPTLTFLTSPTLSCRSGAGSEYCAVSTLSTVVQQRLTPGL